MCVKPIKFLGRWIRADAEDTAIIEDTRKDLVGFLERLDKSALTGLQKCWGYQYMVLPKMKWALAIYDIPLSTVQRWEQTTNRFLRSWLGAGHMLSRRCLFSRDSPAALPIDSLLDTWKVEKCRLQQSYNTSNDTFVTSIEPKVRSGRAWTTKKALEDAKRDLECEAMRGMTQPHPRAGIGFGDWAKPWEKMSDEEKNEAVIGRVKSNIEKETQSELGLLEMQSGWATWREKVIAMDLSWNNMFRLGDSLIAFALRVVYGTAITPWFRSKWDGDEDGICKLCLDVEKTADIKHILSGCDKALQQKRYTWRHNKVLKQIYNQVLYHVEHRVNNPRRSTRTEQEGERIKFISPGEKVESSLTKRRGYSNMGIMTAAKDWKVLVDLDKQLKFPEEVHVQTDKRPDLIMYSKSIKRIIWWELTCPVEENISKAHDMKLDKYAELQVDCQIAGWSCFNVAIEVGARGFAAESLQRAAAAIGIRGRAVKKLMREAGQEALHCSKWIYWLSEKIEWEARDVA